MPKYDQDFIRKVSEANDIVDIISHYVPLKQKGRTYSACCPFHSEKTPSFHVDRDKQLYHCFGCGAGGDVIKFIMEMENTSFSSAIKYLAENAGIELPSNYDDKKARENEERRSRLLKMNESAANFYYKNLIKSTSALNYLRDRGIGAAEIKKFGLGLAPDNWTTIRDYLISIGYTAEEILRSGLVLENRDGTSQYDRFRNRVIFPIQNTMNRVIGFGARKIAEDDRGPKYLNSSETEVFKKGGELFNLNRAKNALRGEPLVLVEGYMDVIALVKYGFENVAAALGTSFTEKHQKLISRYTKEVILCFDGDKAGESATERALTVLENSEDLDVKIVRLPAEHDPDSFIRAYGTEAFREQLNSAVPIIDFRISLIENRNDLTTSAGVMSFLRDSLKLLENLKPVERDYYSKIIAQKSDVDAKSIVEQLPTQSAEVLSPEPVKRPERNQFRTRVPRELAEAQIVFLLFAYSNPHILETVEIDVEMLTSTFFKWFFKKLSESDESEPDLMETMTEEERLRFGDKVRIILVDEYKKIDLTNKSLLEKSVETIKKYNRQIQISKLSSNESLLVSGDEQKSGLFSSIIEMKKVDF